MFNTCIINNKVCLCTCNILPCMYKSTIMTNSISIFVYACTVYDKKYGHQGYMKLLADKKNSKKQKKIEIKK